MHRNSQPRFYDETNTYFITTNTQDSYPFFQEGLFCELFVETLRLCKKLKQFELYAFVIMLEHVHLLIYPLGKFNISEIMHAVKRHFSRDVNLIIRNQNVILNNNNEVPDIPEGEDSYPRLQGYLQGYPPLQDFKKIIQKHQEKVKILQQKFIQKHGTNRVFPPFKWQSSFHDHVIRGEKDFVEHYNYIIYNPEKHGLVKYKEDYPWSSLNQKFYDFTDPA